MNQDSITEIAKTFEEDRLAIIKGHVHAGYPPVAAEKIANAAIAAASAALAAIEYLSMVDGHLALSIAASFSAMSLIQDRTAAFLQSIASNPKEHLLSALRDTAKVAAENGDQTLLAQLNDLIKDIDAKNNPFISVTVPNGETKH
jgi:hypothetical protein